MITYYLGDTEVRGYAQDLARRLDGDSFPSVWFALGQSGARMADVVAESLNEERRRELRVVRVTCDRTTKAVRIIDDISTIDLGMARVLVIDSAIHSGSSMLTVCEYLATLGAGSMATYSLVLKISSCFVPSFFGVLIGEEDRAYFQLDELPNNRLMKSRDAYGYIRPIREEDVLLPTIAVGVESVESSFGELLYEHKARGSSVYLFIHNNEVCGFVCFRVNGDRLFLNTLASGSAHRSRGVGTALVRWAETYARSRRCRVIELWAIDSKIDFYANLDFSRVEGRKIRYSNDVSYNFMRRKILYSTRENDHSTL